MLRKVGAKVLWLTKGAALFGGAVVTLALVLGVATVALGANGGNFILGRNNVATALTRLTGNVQGPAMQVQNTNAGADDTGLSLSVQPGESPMRVNSTGRVTNLNADKLDGKDFASFGATGVISGRGPLPKENTYTSKGGTLLISASGSGYRDSFLAEGPGQIGMYLIVDGVYEDAALVTTNELDSHKAFVTNYTVVDLLPAGNHTIRLEPRYQNGVCNTASEQFNTDCTTTDSSDFFDVSVIEIPD